jgi:hypothetical protein
MNDYAGLEELLARALRGAPSIGPDFESAEMMATSSSSSSLSSSSGSGGGGLEAVYLEEEEHGLTALYAAVLRGDERAAEALLAKGAMPENGGCRGVPPLFSAAARGNADLVRTTTTTPRPCIFLYVPNLYFIHLPLMTSCLLLLLWWWGRCGCC